jgi:enoyl-[acyl-carrier-protein] reductase (NADH)
VSHSKAIARRLSADGFTVVYQRGTRQRRKDGLRNVQAAMIGLTRQLAIELAADNITVNSVAPGPVDTATARAVHTELTRASYLTHAG